MQETPVRIVQGVVAEKSCGEEWNAESKSTTALISDL